MRHRQVLSTFVSLLLTCGSFAAADTTPDGAAQPWNGQSPEQLRALMSATLEDCQGKAPVDGPDRGATRVDRGDFGDVYPMNLVMMGQQAIVMTEFLVDALGNPRFVHAARVVSNNSNEQFSSAAIQIPRLMTWAPALRRGQPVPSWKRLKIKFIDGPNDSMGKILSVPRLKEVLVGARKGDIKSIEMASYLHSIADTEVQLTRKEEFDYLADSALLGERNAALRVAQLLSSPTCAKPSVVRDILKKQAMSGYSAAEMVLAGELMQTNDPATYEQIVPLLHGAANSSDAFVALWATGLLATTPIAELRDPAFALQSALQMKEPQDPDTLEAIAAAQAANAKYDDAVASEQKALKAAAKLKWKDAEMQKRLVTYQSGKPWTGYLCDCQQLVPGEGI